MDERKSDGKRGRGEVCKTRPEPLMHTSTGVEVSLLIALRLIARQMTCPKVSQELPRSLSLSPALRLCIEETSRSIKELSKKYLTNNLRVSRL